MIRQPIFFLTRPGAPPRRLVLACGLLLTSICGSSPAYARPIVFGDMDGDGYRSDRLRGGTDCDDSDPSVNPAAIETCDGVDEDCDGMVDDNAGDLYYIDNDHDGWGSAATSARSCKPLSGWVRGSGDCNDRDPAVHPDALELIDGRDQDCDGSLDETSPLDPFDLKGVYTLSPRVLGDVNGDGYDDFVVNAPTAGLFLGGPWLTGDFTLDAADARFDATFCNGQLGQFKALGDLDGDGRDDFGFQCRSDSDYRQNVLYLYRGRSRFSDFTLSQFDSSIISPDANRVLRAVAEHGGDLDADGYADLLVGLPEDPAGGTGAGRVVVFLGGALRAKGTSAVMGDITVVGRANQHLGIAIENVGDLDDDGFPEVFATDNPDGYRERFQVFAGLGSRLGQWTADETAASIYSDEVSYGIRTLRVGDVTGDGIDDLTMSDGYSLYFAASEVGPWYLEDLVVTMGAIASRRTRFATPTSGRYQNLDLRPAGDFNGDRLADFLVGSWGGSTTSANASGVVYLILGVPGGKGASTWPAASTLLNPCTASYCLFASPGSFTGGGDFDGDGLDDFLVGGLEGLTGVGMGR